MPESTKIVIVGATGYTGRLVAREVAAGTIPFALTARSAERLQALAHDVGGAGTHVVDVTQPDSLAAVLERGDVVINCAGPFSDLGAPVVEACIAAGAHYLDITGEQSFMKRVEDRYGKAAGQAQVAVINGMAFEYAIGDCAAALAASRLKSPLRSVDMVYAWYGGVKTSSRGTRRSVMRVLRDGGYDYVGGRYCRQKTGALRRTVQLPGGQRRAAVWFPAGEIVTVPRHQQVRNVRAWIAVGRAQALAVPRIARALPRLVQLVNPLFEWYLGRAPDGPLPEQRRSSRFLIRAEVIGADGERACIDVDGANPYELTATIACHAARELLHAASRIAGVLAPAQLLDPAAFLNMLREYDLVWDDSYKDGDHDDRGVLPRETE